MNRHRPTTRTSLLVLLLAWFGGLDIACDRAADAPPAVVRVPDDDERMGQATAEARANVSTFRAALQNPAPGQTNFMVKFAARDGDTIEHLWVAPVRFDGARFVGPVANDPERISTVSAGQEVKVPANEIVDWMYVEDGKLVGGYTLRVARRAMSTRDRREFDRSLPFRIE